MNMETEPSGKEFPAPVFIIGCMRSGTTFLVDKLTQHPQLLKVGNELREVWSTIGQAPCDPICIYKNASETTPEASANMAYYFSTFIEESKSLKRHLMRAKTKWQQGSSAIFYDWPNIHPVNKSTRLINKISYVHALFPKAKIIIIVRDIYAQSASMKNFFAGHLKKNKWLFYMPEAEKDSWTRFEQNQFPQNLDMQRLATENFRTIPDMWIRLNALAIKDLQVLPTNSYHLVSYEELTLRQETVLNKVFTFLNLESKHSNKSNQIASEPLKIINTQTSGDPLTKWKKQLSPKEIRDIELAIDEAPESYHLVQKALDENKIA